MADGTSYGSHVDNPAQHFTTEPWCNQRQYQYKQDGIDWSFVFLVHLAEELRQGIFIGHGIHQTAGGDEEGIDTRNNCTEHRYTQNDQSYFTQSFFHHQTGCPERTFGQKRLDKSVCHGFKPIAVIVLTQIYKSAATAMALIIRLRDFL